VLDALGIRIEDVRRTIESVIGRNERTIIQQIIPTSRVKKVIELSFEEARRMGHQYVGTEHILLGIVLEGEGIAAHVLSDLGATLETVRAEIERQLAASGSREAMQRPPAPPQPFASAWSDLETLDALLSKPHIAALLRAKGLDVDALSGQLRSAPELVRNLRRHLAGIEEQLKGAVGEADYERAAHIQKARLDLAARLHQAELDWLEELTR
jgi:ATP-dependent Clp protease ATP-binding subunit ClpA